MRCHMHTIVTDNTTVCPVILHNHAQMHDNYYWSLLQAVVKINYKLIKCLCRSVIAMQWLVSQYTHYCETPYTKCS